MLLCTLGTAAFAISLVANMPARFVAERFPTPAQIVNVYGTVWNGQVALQGDYKARWTVLPLDSLLQLAVAVDWSLAGPDTALSGRAALRNETVSLSSVEGRAGWGLVRLAAPGLSVVCDGMLAVSMSSVTLARDRQGAIGELRTGPSTCVDTAGKPSDTVDLPALTGASSVEGDAWRLRIAPAADPASLLADLTVAGRVLAITVQPEGARLMKSLPGGGPITLEFPF